MADVQINLKASSSSAKKEISSLEKLLEASAKRIGQLFNRGGSGQAVTGITKQMQALTKATDQQIQKIQLLQQALSNVQRQQQSLSGLQGIGRQGQAQALNAQATQLQRSLNQANTRLGVLNQLGSAAQGMAQPAPLSPSNNPFNVGRTGLTSFIGSIAKDFLGPLAAIGTAAGAAAIIRKAYEESANREKTMADLLPRLLGPGAAGQARSAGMRIGMMGLGRGFTTRESLQAAEAMSLGGSKLGNGLERDTRAAMDMARVFGLDVGGQATTLAEGAKMGAFKPGDARRFAQMLANEISRSGLGPRAQEVQEATLMLLNRQMQNEPSAQPGGIMGLQFLLNKTGIPAFTGMQGAGLLSNVQQRLSNPQDESSLAFMQAVHMSLGAKGIFDLQRRMERGIDDPRVLPRTIAMAMGGAGGNKDAAKFMVERLTGISMLKLDALDKAGLFTGLTSGKMKAAEAIIKGGGGSLEKGAAQAMALKGNQLRLGDATLDQVFQRIGGPIVNAVGKVGEWAEHTLEPMFHTLDDNTKTAAEKLTALADHFIGAPADKATGGVLSNPNTWRIAARAAAAPLGPMGIYMAGQAADALFGGGGGGPLGMLGAAHQMGLTMTSGFRNPSHNRRIGGAAHSLHMTGTPGAPGARDFSGSPTQMDAFFDWVRQNIPPSEILELFDSRKGFVKNGKFFGPNDPGFAGVARTHGNHVHVALRQTIEHHIYEHGPVARATTDHIKSAIKTAGAEHARETARAHPNVRNPR